MTKGEMQVIIGAVLSALEGAGKSPVATATATTGRLSAKDAALVRGFKRKGIKDVVLMDRNDPSKAFNVRPFKGWLALGRIVRKGEHGVRGLFHISQTDKVEAETPKASPAPARASAPAAEAAKVGLKTFAELAALKS